MPTAVVRAKPRRGAGPGPQGWLGRAAARPRRAVAWPADVRGPFRPVRRHIHASSGAWPAEPGRRRRSAARDPHGPPPGDVNLLVVRDVIGRLRTELVGAELYPQPRTGPAGREGGARRAGQGPGRDGPEGHVRVEAPYCCAPRPAYREPAKRPSQPSWPAGSSSRAATHYSWGPTCSVRPPSSSCGSLGPGRGAGVLRRFRSGHRGQERPG